MPLSGLKNNKLHSTYKPLIMPAPTDEHQVSDKHYYDSFLFNLDIYQV